MKIAEFTPEERKMLQDRIARGIPEWERAEFIDLVVLRLIRQVELLELENIELRRKEGQS